MALDDELRARFARQILLPELGQAGQERIVAGCAAVGASTADASLAHELAEHYARRAGFERVRYGHIDEISLAPREVVSHQAPRAVLAGARAALAAIREAADVR